MKLRIVVPSVALAVAGVLPTLAPAAGAVDTTQVTIVDGLHHNAEVLQPLTVCFDDTLVQQGEAVINPTITSTPGVHTLSISEDEAACGDDVDWVSGEVTLLDVPSQSVAFNSIQYNDDQTTTLPTMVFEDDLSCTPADQGRIVYRNITGRGDYDVFFGADTDPEPTALFEHVGVGDQASALVASPSYPETGEAIGWSYFDNDDTSDYFIFELSDSSYDTASGTVNVVYAYGSADGGNGLVNQVLPASLCDTPAPPTTVPAPPAPAAVAVTTQPTYTG